MRFPLTRTLIVFTTLLIGYFVFGFYLSQMDESIIPLELKPENMPNMHDYRGVINVQTTRSSGSADPAEVIAEGKTAGLDFLILTDRDHDSQEGSVNGYHGNMLVMDESEYDYLDSRLIYLSGDRSLLPSEASEKNIYVTDLLSQKWSAPTDQMLILSYPFNHGPTWSGDFPTGIQGLEVMNSKSISAKAWERSKFNVFWSIVSYPFNPRYAFLRLFQDPSDEVALWDKILKSHPLWGFAAADANARAFPLADYLLRFPPYSLSFSIMSNHIVLPAELTGNFEKDREKIMNAFRKGHFYFALDLLGDPRGFESDLVDQENKLPMGSSVKFHKGQRLRARLRVEPHDFFEIVLLQNGERVATSNTQELVYEPTSPGIYRFFVRVSTPFPVPDGRKWISWIYTNPFFLLESGSGIEYHEKHGTH